MKEKLKVPDKLPLLEGLCWNIADPYSLSCQEMLGIYEERWHFVGVLGKPSSTETEFIKQITKTFGGLPLLEINDVDRQEFFNCVKAILRKLNIELLERHKTCLGGGSLIGLKHGTLRRSSDLDFLVNPKNYNQIKRAINNGAKIIPAESDLVVGEPRIDRYGIRYPLTIVREKKEINLKLEIVAEYNLDIGTPDKCENVPCLNLIDRITAKLIANADRWCDRNKFSRDLIDLAIIANQQQLPSEAIVYANNIYPDAEKCLIEAIEQFQDLADYRQKCYQTLQVSEPYAIVNGLDKLAQNYGLPPTKRSFGEIDFGYLDEVSPSSPDKLNNEEKLEP